MLRTILIISAAVILCLLVLNFSQFRVAATIVDVATGASFADQPEGLRFRLSEGADQPKAELKHQAAPSTRLSETETETILNRLPLITDQTDEQDFELRESSLLPPRAGEVKQVEFSPPVNIPTPDLPESGPLKVLRYAPEGNVPIASQLSITFSQPMVPLDSHEKVAEHGPVKLSPQPPGKWRWLGTKTLLFEPEDRFPMATQYSVTVPSGVRSVNGGALAAEKSWMFSTPVPTIKTTFPNDDDPQPRDTLMFVGFDQRIDPAALLKRIKVSSGQKEIQIRAATPAEIAANTSVRWLAESFADRYVAFRAVDSTGQTATALPQAARITVSVNAGAPSAEGPRTTGKLQRYAFRTHGVLGVTTYGCETKRCRPSDLWEIEFNNPIDAATIDESRLRIEPPIDDLEISVWGETLTIDGVKHPRTIYRVTLDPSTKDKFGQMLGPRPALTFRVGSTRRNLFAGYKDFVVLDPFGPAKFSVYSVNYHSLRVKLHSVGPEDYARWINYQSQISDNPRLTQISTPPGRLAFMKTIGLTSKPDQITETEIDLAPALSEGIGQMILIVQAVSPIGKIENSLGCWLQRTNIGLDAFVDNNELVAWATSLKDGSPLSGVEMKLLASDSLTPSGTDGTARLRLPPRSTLPDVLVARQGQDVAILPRQVFSWEDQKSTWYRKPQEDSLRWYVFDDRKLYRPGDEVRVKGWIRRVGASQQGDVGAPGNPDTVTDVIYSVKDSRNIEITKAGARLGPLGGFDLRLKLPPTMNLGRATVELLTNSNLPGSKFNHSFAVEEFRRPEFEVTAKTESDGPYIVGSEANVSVTAAYFAGGGLQDADVTWKVTSQPGSFTPPNRQDWTFGKWKPWWTSFSYHPTRKAASHSESLTGKTDARGKHVLHINFDSVSPPQPSTVKAEVSVKDVNRQEWSSTTTMLVHPASLYVGLRSEKTFVQSGEPLVVQSLVTDLDGNAVSGREIKLRAVQLDWKQLNGEWQQVETNPRDCSLKSSAEAAVCTFPTSDGGQYRVTAIILDDHDRRNESEITFWVAGNQPIQRELEEKKVELIPDRKEYQPGDVAEILVQAPFYPATGLLTLSRSGILRTERFTVSAPTHVLRVSIEEAWTPNVHLRIDLVGVEDGESKRAAFGSSELSLSIPPIQRRLQITATPREKILEPGAETSIAIELKDQGGKAVGGGEVAVVVVDESVLALTNYKLDDPLGVFYTPRDSETTDFHLRQDVLTTLSPAEKERLLQTFLRKAAGGGPGGGAGGSVMRTIVVPAELAPMSYASFRLAKRAGSPTPTPAPIHLRENFDALAAFAPSVQTDANGRATVQVKVPDNLTRYRVMAVAVAGGKHFGIGESVITARLPLMVRASAPRFLNFGDRFDLPVVVQNQTENPLTVDVAVRATNATLSESRTEQSTSTTDGRRVTVPANDRVEVRFPASPAKPGAAHFQIAAVAGSLTDATGVTLPIHTPATTEVFATYGQIDDGGVAQPVKAPDHVFPQFGGLEITTSSTQLPELTDAVLYLTSYPYECSEQIASRVLGIVALQDVMEVFKSKALPSPAELTSVVNLDLKRLERLQHSNGGYSFWRQDDDDWPYLSIHVAHAFARARDRGFAVRNDSWKKSLEYLRRIETHIPHHYSKESRGALIAYAVYVRALMNDNDPARARKLIQETGLQQLSLEAVGWLLNVLSGDKRSTQEVELIRRLLNNRATETAGAAHFVISYTDGAEVLLHSDRRADGVILEALIRDQPQNDLIPKIVKGLLAHRRKGRWDNTQENVFILLAMDRYFKTYEKVSPDFVARVWLGNAYGGEQKFNGRTADSFNMKLPMSYLVNHPGEQPLTLTKDGAGRLYYRVSLSYAPVNLNLNSADHGFDVQRTYEALDQPDDVRQEADGSWRIKPGARVRVRVHMVASERRYHVALVDPMPAGFEALNPALATSRSIPDEKRQVGSLGRSPWHRVTVWFNHQNLRDDRAEAFASLLWEGVYTYSYVARATTPGLFVVPPPKVEEMYSPETFGRGKTDYVRID